MGTFKGKVSGGKFFPDNNKTYDLYVASFEGREVEVTIEKFVKKRTDLQNKSLHLWHQQLADELNEKHFDMRALIRDGIEIPWTAYGIKEYLVKPLLEARTGKTSTTKITTDELNDIIDIITKVIAERTKGECEYVPFPSMENLMEE